MTDKYSVCSFCADHNGSYCMLHNIQQNGFLLCCNILAAELYTISNPHQFINLYWWVLKVQVYMVQLNSFSVFQLYYFVLFYVYIVLLLLFLLSYNYRNLVYCYTCIHLLCVRLNICTLKKRSICIMFILILQSICIIIHYN